MESKSISDVTSTSRHMSGILEMLCISLLSESAAIPPEVQHYPIKQKRNHEQSCLIFASEYIFDRPTTLYKLKVLTFCGLKTPKLVHWQTVKTQMNNAAFDQGLHCLLGQK